MHLCQGLLKKFKKLSTITWTRILIGCVFASHDELVGGDPQDRDGRQLSTVRAGNGLGLLQVGLVLR